MMGDSGLPPPELPHEPALSELAPSPPPVPPLERFPFWGYHDLCVFIGLFVVSLILGFATSTGFTKLFRLHVQNDVLKLVPAQFLAYLYVFLGLWLLFRTQYGRPFWSSLGWTRLGINAGAIIAYGVLLAFAVGIGSQLLHTPEGPTPMSKLLSDRLSIMVLAVAGVTLGPLCEELIFRGFMQPLFVRSMGAVGGILAAAVPFGLLHLQEYGFAWQPGVMITLAGAAFGWMRHRTGSTKASTLMHAAYNSTFFLALLAQPKNLPH
jgi:membrane protease YdiL (CAAX protease family)